MRLAACVNITVQTGCAVGPSITFVRGVCVGVCLCVLASHYHVKRADTSSAFSRRKQLTL